MKYICPECHQIRQINDDRQLRAHVCREHHPAVTLQLHEEWLESENTRLTDAITRWTYGVHAAHRSCNCPRCQELMSLGLELMENTSDGK